VVDDLVTDFGVGVGRGGAIVRSRIAGEGPVGSVVDEFEFCARHSAALENRIDEMAKSFFIG
jgi:hypothetical protein